MAAATRASAAPAALERALALLEIAPVSNAPQQTTTPAKPTKTPKGKTKTTGTSTTPSRTTTTTTTRKP